MAACSSPPCLRCAFSPWKHNPTGITDPPNSLCNSSLPLEKKIPSYRANAVKIPPRFHHNGAAHEVPAYVAQKALLVAQFLLLVFEMTRVPQASLHNIQSDTQNIAALSLVLVLEYRTLPHKITAHPGNQVSGHRTV